MHNWKQASILLFFVVSLILSSNASRQRKSTWHSIQKRSCNIRGENCLKDIDCCTAECVCTSNQCSCGNRPKAKVANLKLKPNFLPQAQRLEQLLENRLEQRHEKPLECGY